MNTDKNSSSKRKRLLAWLLPICLLGVAFVIFKVYQEHRQPLSETVVTSKPLAADDVRFAYVSGPLPMTEPYQPLFPDRDSTTIHNLLQWIQQAQEVKTEKLQMPTRSESVTVEMKDGKSVSVQYAWTCQSTTSPTGNPGTECSNVKDRVMILKDDSKPIFVISKELYSFLQQAPQSIPHVSSAVYPNQIKLGSTFRVEGNAWLNGKVTVRLLNGKGDRNNPYWSGEATPDHGHFEMEIPCPQVEPGGYQLEYLEDHGREMIFPISITK